MSAKKVVRNGLPDRFAIEGMQHLVTDEVGVKKIEDLKKKYFPEEDSLLEAQMRPVLRKELQDLLNQLKYEGRLFRRDGGPLV